MFSHWQHTNEGIKHVRCIHFTCRIGDVRLNTLSLFFLLWIPAKVNRLSWFWPWEMNFILLVHLNIIHHQSNSILQERLYLILKSGNMNSVAIVSNKSESGFCFPAAFFFNQWKCGYFCNKPEICEAYNLQFCLGVDSILWSFLRPYFEIEVRWCF